jgi:hypothetical protein
MSCWNGWSLTCWRSRYGYMSADVRGRLDGIYLAYDPAVKLDVLDTDRSPLRLAQSTRYHPGQNEVASSSVGDRDPHPRAQATLQCTPVSPFRKTNLPKHVGDGNHHQFPSHEPCTFLLHDTWEKGQQYEIRYVTSAS